MTLKQFLLYPIENPMRPVLLCCLSMPLLFAGMLVNIELLSAVGGIIFLASLLLLVLSFFYLLIKGEWTKSLYTLIFILTIGIIIGLLN